MHSEDVARTGSAANATQQRRDSLARRRLYAKKEFSNGIKLELGGIMAATEKVDELFTFVDSENNVYLDQIEFEDTLGFRGKLTLTSRSWATKPT